MTIDKTADVRPAKDPEEKLGDAIDEAIEEEGEEVKPNKLKSPTVDKTGDIKEKKD